MIDIRITPRTTVQRDRRVAERKRPVKTGPDHKWSSLEITHVMQMASKRMSYSQIAKAFGCTKNAICGVIFKERRRQAKRGEARGRAA